MMAAHKKKTRGVKVFSCMDCEYTSRCHTNFQAHRNRHTGDKPFCCTQCSMSFASAADLNRHMRYHFEDRPFKCSMCSYATKVKADLLVHEKRHSEMRCYKCATCGHRSKTSGDLKKHELRHSDIRPYKCDMCDFTTKQASCLRTHKTRHSSKKPFTGRSCVLKTKSATGLFNDVESLQFNSKRMNTKRKRLSCPVCGEKIMDKSFLARHVCKCPVDLNGTLVCRECDALFDTTAQLQNHALTAHEQKLSLNVKDENQAERETCLTLTCPCCLLSFSSLVKLKNHVTEHERATSVDGVNHMDANDMSSYNNRQPTKLLPSYENTMAACTESRKIDAATSCSPCSHDVTSCIPCNRATVSVTSAQSACCAVSAGCASFTSTQSRSPSDIATSQWNTEQTHDIKAKPILEEVFARPDTNTIRITAIDRDANHRTQQAHGGPAVKLCREPQHAHGGPEVKLCRVPQHAHGGPAVKLCRVPQHTHGGPAVKLCREPQPVHESATVKPCRVFRAKRPVAVTANKRRSVKHVVVELDDVTDSFNSNGTDGSVAADECDVITITPEPVVIQPIQSFSLREIAEMSSIALDVDSVTSRDVEISAIDVDSSIEIADAEDDVNDISSYVVTSDEADGGQWPAITLAKSS